MAEQVYRVGDSDPTPNDGPLCRREEANKGYSCTREPGHLMPHVAGTGRKIVAVWEDPPAIPTYDEVGDAVADLLRVNHRSSSLRYEAAADDVVALLIDRGWLAVRR